MQARRRAAGCLLVIAAIVMPWVGAGPVLADSLGTLVIDGDAPDPEVLVDIDGRSWMFTTQVGLQSVPVWSAADLGSWSPAGDALPLLGTWARWGFTWSPGVERFDSSYVMYYTARSGQYGVQCIGRAVASAPGGPYTDTSDAPAVCQPELGGSIDADIHRDATGAPWLVWKSDGSAIGVASRIWTAPLAADGSGVIGPPAMLLTSTSADEGIIENPTMAFDGGRTFLVFSVGPWWTSRYHQERAICSGPTGPCHREVGEWLGPASGLTGPGGGALFLSSGGEWMLAVHAWRGGVGYENGGRRSVWIGPAALSRSPIWHILPIGNLEAVALNPVGPGTPGRTATAIGWALDWDVAHHSAMYITVDGVFAAYGLADVNRPDVEAAFPTVGSDHGFVVQVPLDVGTSTICVWAVDDAFGHLGTMLGCRTVSVPTQAFGNLESVRRVPGGATVSGWGIDPYATDPVEVQAWEGGRLVGWSMAAASRPDVGAAFPGFGSGHGFEVDLALDHGIRTPCTYLVGVPPGPPTLAGCRTIAISSTPIGNLEQVTRTGGLVTLDGWALDPDTTAATQVHVLVDGRLAGFGTTGVARPDVAAVFPDFGSTRGFHLEVTVGSGSHQVCAYAVDGGPGTYNPLLRCAGV